MSLSNHRGLLRCASVAFAVVMSLGLVSCSSSSTDKGGTDKSTGAQASDGVDLGPGGEKVVDIIEAKMKELDLTGAVYGVWRGDDVVAVGGLGDSPVGVRANVDMQVRIGQPMEPMLSTVLLQLDGEGVLKQDEPIAKYLPDFPRADKITPRMLADSTSGISDYVTDPDWNKAFYANPFKGFTADELLGYANARPPVFEPGTNFGYAHSDLVLLGEVLQKATGKKLGDLIQERILDPLAMKHSKVMLTPQIFDPIFHGYTNERGVFEDSSFWNPTAFLHSGNMNTTVGDVATWIRALMSGKVLSKEQFSAMMEPSTAGIGPFTKSKFFAYGVVHDGDWIFMNPAYGGYHGAVYYDTTSKTLVIVYCSLGPKSDASVDNALPIGKAIATELVPDRPPTM
ncbi:serine hydrolase domain-containing protein [Smaragdicoccus niigatensis]|uniref:serine hydrolase domain-containing protein n=1 Tax=Smaragdicoccus niigatensis TaxID=359359 RepID=UPI00047641A7|nr:serine hydrolase domain-containing protein [Smaragdicoccus niigatensis]